MKGSGGPAPAAPAGGGAGLRKNALGFPTVLAQSIAVISPTMTAVLIIALAFGDAGNGTWLAYAFGTVMLLFVVGCLNQFAKRSALAGSMYGYTGRGLGPKAGVISGWSLIWAYLFIGVAGLAGFAIFAQQFLSGIGIGGTVPPVILFLLAAGVCWFIAYKDIHVSSLLTLVFECVSVACIVALAFVVLFKHGITIDTTIVKAKGMTLHGLSLAVVICIFSLVGFESATTLGGEAKNPLKNIPRAVVVSLLITGAFMVFMSYVEVFGTRHAGTALNNIALPLTVLSKIYGVTFFKVPVPLGAMVSFFSLTLSCLNAGSRIIYPMAQHMIFPTHLGRAHKENQTPHIAITVYIVAIVTIPVVLEIFTNPLTTFGDAGTLAAFGFLTAYFLITFAAPVYLKKLGELRPRNVVVAATAALLLMVPLIGSFYPVPPWPVDIFPYIFVAYVLAGSGWLFAVSRRNRGIFAEIEMDLEGSMLSPEKHTEAVDRALGRAAGAGTPAPAPVAVAAAADVVLPPVGVTAG
ncbi:MAG TPA: APC family permease [Acidimicrobiales bacterium]|nr:APC family permease [Acidimicrobiales bacterium]